MIDLVFKILILLLTAVSAVMDIRKRVIPNALCIAIALCGILRYIFEREELFDGCVGLVVTAVIMLICFFVSKDGIGMGDIKLLCALSFALGFSHFIKGLLFTALVSSFVTLVLLAFKRVKKNDNLPFAPFILFGMLGGVFL